MVTNFETITIPMTDEEISMANLLVKSFKQNPEGTVWTSSQIIKGFARHGYICSGARVRKIISYIRRNSVAPILASSSGYYLSYNIDEIKRQIISLDDRIAGIRSARDGLSAFLH